MNGLLLLLMFLFLKRLGEIATKKLRTHDKKVFAKNAGI